MFGLGHKRSRVSRSASLRAPETIRGRLLSISRDRAIMIRMGLGLCAILLLTLGLQSWRAPFPFREGDYAPHGLAAKTEFQREDQKETQRALERAENEVPFVFTNDPRALELLPEQLRAALGEVTQAGTWHDLRDQTQVDFGFLVPPARSGSPSQSSLQKYHASDPEARFAALKQSIVGEDMSMAQQRIDEMVDDFTKFISPLKKTGLIDPDDERKQRITADRSLRVINEGAESSEEMLLLPQVRLADRLNDAGDLGKSWLSYPSLQPAIHAALSHWLLARSVPSLRYDQVATKRAIEEARKAVPTRMERYLPGDQLVEPRETITAEKLQLLNDEYNATEANISWTSRVIRVGISFLLTLVLAVINGYYIVRNEPRLFSDFSRFMTYLGVIVVTTFVSRLLSFDPMRAEIVPLLVTLLLLSIAYNQFLATLTAFSLCLILSLSTTARLDHFVVILSACAAAIIPLSGVSSRSTLIRVSITSAIAYVLVNYGVRVIETQGLGEVFRNEAFLMASLKGGGLCMMAGFIVAGSLPFLEKTFSVVTDMSLRELSDPSHPLLQELVRSAPGTYNHSISVASIAEAAAKKIGANALLVKVGAHFHDVGKMLKPHYFIENIQAGCENRHKQLNPTMSTLIIIGHVKDGVDLGKKFSLPTPIIDFIQEHHGTTLVEYFFNEAAKQAEANPDRYSEAEESAFRYPGPKPRTRETAILMICDASESACRTLSEPTPKRIETLVHQIVLRRLLDGQFDDCDLKMSEIRDIEESVVKSLIGFYHGRIRYPAEAETRPA